MLAFKRNAADVSGDNITVPSVAGATRIWSGFSGSGVGSIRSTTLTRFQAAVHVGRIFNEKCIHCDEKISNYLYINNSLSLFNDYLPQSRKKHKISQNTNIQRICTQIYGH